MNETNTNMKFNRKGTLRDGFTWILNITLNDKELTSCPEAVVVFLKISQYENSPTHKISIRGMATQTGLSIGKIGKGFKKLIELGYVSRVPIYKGNLINGYEYDIYDIREENENLRNENTSKSSSKNYGETVGNTRGIENGDTDFGYTENTNLKKKIGKKENRKKENKDVVGDKNNSNLSDEKLIKEDMIIELYKTYKIQSRVMPQMKKLLLAYADKIDLELYEEIFMLASEDNVKSKYKYIQDLLIKFDTKGIYTLEAYKLDCEEFKNKKKASTSNNKSKGYKGQKNGSNNKPNKTKFHNFESQLDDMSNSEVEETLAISQYKKFNNQQQIRIVYNKAIKHGLQALSTDEVKKAIIEYAVFENLEIPK